MPKLVDYYGRRFNQNEIQNKDCVDLVSRQGIDALSSEEIRRNTVFISDQHGKKLYMRSQLIEMLKSNHFTRLSDPITRADLIEQLPDFKAVVVNFEGHAADYNAHVLDKYPEFIQLLTDYVRIILDPKDRDRFISARPEEIIANSSPELDRIHATINDFDESTAAAFHSLFITNREYFYDPDAQIIEFPAKWIRTTENKQMFDRFESSQYRLYPHRNVHVGDAFEHTHDACMHSWGMDILHLLLQYRIGTNKLPFIVFSDQRANPLAYRMEQQLYARLSQETSAQGLLQPTEGELAYKKVRNFTIQEGERLLSQFDNMCKKCTNYMDYLLTQLKTTKTSMAYPEPDMLMRTLSTTALIAKYTAVYEMYEKLQDTTIEKPERIQGFLRLYGERERLATIRSHRDSFGIQFLNILGSLLSLGLKNLITYCKTDRNYAGFWRSRGNGFTHDVSQLLNDTPIIPSKVI